MIAHALVRHLSRVRRHWHIIMIEVFTQWIKLMKTICSITKPCNSNQAFKLFRGARKTTTMLPYAQITFLEPLMLQNLTLQMPVSEPCTLSIEVVLDWLEIWVQISVALCKKLNNKLCLTKCR